MDQLGGIHRVSTSPPLSGRQVSVREDSGRLEPADGVDLGNVPLTQLLDRETLRGFLHAIPKVDLHRHLEGTIDPETLADIGKRKNLQLPSYDPEELRPYLQVTENDRTLLDFIKKFETIGLAFSDRDAVEEITYNAVKSCSEDNVKYAELRFSPVYMAQQYNLDIDDIMNGVLSGVERAKEDFDTGINLVMIVERQMGPEHADFVKSLAEKYMDRGVVGLDLANDEYNFPPGPYAEVFQAAKDAGLHITVHAGEAGGAENVQVSVENLKADRIGHGVRSKEDPAVLQLLKDRGTTLEMCPTSNVQTGSTENMDTHPLKDFYDQGLNVTINTDDPGISGITLTDEYVTVVERFGFTLSDVKQFIMNGINSAFLPENERKALKEKHLSSIDALAGEFLVAPDNRMKKSDLPDGFPGGAGFV